MANSDKENNFAFGKIPSTDKQNEEVNVASDEKVETSDVSLPVEGDNDVANPVDESSDIKDDEEYTDISSVTVKLVKNYSLYRKVNDKVLQKRVDYIGSSVSSSRILSANKKEIETYFPNIVGVAPNNETFITRVKQYLNNIRIRVDELGKTFNTSFHYYKYSSYKYIRKEENRIETRYQKADKTNIKKLREALNERITQLNALESSKCELGYPINVDDYLMYRHCMLYRDIAKDIALVNTDANIRFYFQDDAKEEEKRRSQRNAITTAKSYFVKCIAEPAFFQAVYVQYCALNGLPIVASLSESTIDQENKLDRFSTEEPVKFNKICSNKNLYTISTIEMLISRGDLVRSQYNQNITTTSGEFVGANMNEAVVWFKNPANSAKVHAYQTKLKLI